MIETPFVHISLSYPDRRYPDYRERFDGERWVRIPYLRPVIAPKPKVRFIEDYPDRACKRGHTDAWRFIEPEEKRAYWRCDKCKADRDAADRERMRLKRADMAAHARELELAKARRDAGYIRPSRRAA